MKKLRFLPLEERIVLDAAAATDASAAHADAAPPPAAILVVSNTVQDHDTLAYAAKEGVKVVTYDAQNTSLQTLSDLIHAAANGSQVASIALATDGSSGNFLVTGTSFTNLETLTDSTNQSIINFWKGIAGNLLPNGSIAILGCQVASGDLGQNTITALESIIHDVGAGLSVFASTDDTGSSLLGGNWILERGNFDAAAAYFDPTAIQDWHQTLSPTATVQATFFDFKQSVYNHPDFFGHFPTLGSPTYGMVSDDNSAPFPNYLTAGGTPIYDPVRGPLASTNAASFAQWFHATSGVNTQVLDNLVWTNNASGAFLNWGNASFRPIDGQGYGNEGAGFYNPNFTMMMTAYVTFPIGETNAFIHVISNGDTWVYINGVNSPLIADLGGVHTAYTQTFSQVFGYPLNLPSDTYDGSLMQIQVFFASRNSDVPNLQIFIEDATVFTQLYELTPIDSNTSEGGGTGQFSVVLPFRPVNGRDIRWDPIGVTYPTQTFTISFGTTDSGEGAAPAPISFNYTNWNIPQIVTVLGVNDFVDDGNQPFTITSSWSSNLPIYRALSGLNGPSSGTGDSQAFTNVDNDTTGVIYNSLPINTTPSGLSVNEAGATTTSYTIQLSSRPLSNVTLAFNLVDTTPVGNEAQISVNGSAFSQSGSYVFAPTGSNAWNNPITIVLRAIDDLIDDNNQNVIVQTTVSATSDPTYGAFNPPDAQFTVIDNDTAGFTVTPTSGLITTEAGGTATFTVKLNSQPTANVTIGVSSGDATEGLPDLASLVFTSANWNTAQTVTVTGQNDALPDGNVPYQIVLGTAVSTDGKYSGKTPSAVSLTNLDDGDGAGFIITPITPLTTTEAIGGTAQFTVRLSTAPTSNVVIHLASDNTAEGIITGGVDGSGNITFTTGNWNVDQTITITGVDDFVDDGDIGYHIVLSPAVSADPIYNNANPADVDVTNIDNDTWGVTVIGGPLITTEWGGTDSFTVVLDSQPTGVVYIPISTTDPTEGVVKTTILLFTESTWNTAQTVTALGVDDHIIDGNINYLVTIGPINSTDTNYGGYDPADIGATNIDDDVASLESSVASIITSEDLTTAYFMVRLTAQPNIGDTVTYNITTSNPAEANALTTSVTFDSTNWHDYQLVKVQGVDDAIIDGNIAYNVLFGPAASGDLNFAGTTLSVPGINLDNDVAGFTIGGSTIITTDETGTQDTVTIVLTTQPTDNVTIPVSTSNPAEGVPDIVLVTFTPGNWNIPQTITVTGQDDALIDGNQPYTLVFGTAVSTDTNYNGLDPNDVGGINQDDDQPNILISHFSIVTTEAGGTATFDVRLTPGFAPTADVIIPIFSDNTGEGTVPIATLTFTSLNYATPQTVIVTGIDDTVVDGDISYNIVIGPASSTDLSYDTLDVQDVQAVNLDNDVPLVNFTPVGPTPDTTTEAPGGTANYDVTLNTQPSGDVILTFTSTDTTEGTVTTTLTFTSLNWNTPQQIVVTGVDDLIADGNIPYNITTTTSSSDPFYNNLTVDPLIVTNLDNDTPGISYTPLQPDILHTTEFGGIDILSIVLDTMPTGNVTVIIDSTVPSEALPNNSTSSTTIVFTPLDWFIPQNVNIVGQNDDIVDGTQPFQIIFHSLSSDPNYVNLINYADGENIDNDTPNIVINDGDPLNGITTTEGPTAVTFPVYLTTAPAAPVTITFTSNDPSEAVGTTITFDGTNWNVPQTVTITGVDDVLVDGPQGFIITTTVTSADPNYGGFVVNPFNGTNLDNDNADIVVEYSVGHTRVETTEAGGTDYFRVRLTAQPLQDVVVTLTTLNVAEGQMFDGFTSTNSATLTFTSANWNVFQSQNVIGIDDFVVDGDQLYQISVLTSSLDNNFDNLTDTVNAINADANDVAGVIFTPLTPLTTTETQVPPGTTTFTVTLSSQPTDTVTVTLAGDPLEGVIDTPVLTFTPLDWDIPQIVTVTGLDDFIDDGDITYTLVITDISSPGDPLYDNLTPPPTGIDITNEDNDTASLEITQNGNLTFEDGSSVPTVDFKLTSQPLAPVSFTLNTSNPGEGLVNGVNSPVTLTFDQFNWFVTQTVTVVGQNDALDDGDFNYQITITPLSSADPNYSGDNYGPLLFTNIDDDSPGYIINFPPSGPNSLITHESGTTATFTITLTSQPTGNVTIPILSNDSTEGWVTSSSIITFTPSNWDQAQTVTVTGIDDLVADGNINYSVLLGPSISTDPNFNNLAGSIPGTNIDDDTVNIFIQLGDPLLYEGGNTTVTVVLGSQPTGPVDILLIPDFPNEVSLSDDTLTFTDTNWNVPQTVILHGVDEFLRDGDRTVTLLAVPSSPDAAYDSYSPPSTQVIVIDTSNPINPTRINPEPVQYAALTNLTNATPIVTSLDAGHAAFEPLTTASSPLHEFDFTRNIIVSSFNELTLDNAGSTVEFMVVLSKAPNNPVFLNVELSDSGLADLSKKELIFTPENWREPQKITVTAKEAQLLSDKDLNVIFTPANGDALYNGLKPADVKIKLKGKADGHSHADQPAQDTKIMHDIGIIMGYQSAEQAAAHLLMTGGDVEGNVVEGNMFSKVIDEWDLLAM